MLTFISWTLDDLQSVFFFCSRYPGSVFGVKHAGQICPTRDWEWKQEPTHSLWITVWDICKRVEPTPRPHNNPQLGFGRNISLNLILTLQKTSSKALFPRLVRLVQVQPRSLQPLWNYCIILIAPQKTFLFGSTQTDLTKSTLSDPKFTRFPVVRHQKASIPIMGKRHARWERTEQNGERQTNRRKAGENLFQQILMLIRPNGAALLCFFRQLIACAQSKWIFQTELNQSAVFWN